MTARRKHMSDEDVDEVQVERVPTDLLVGDANSKVGRDLYMRLSVGRYHDLVMSTNVWVEVSVNQDDETIRNAQHTITKIAEGWMKEYQPKMQRILDAAAEDQ